MQKTRSTHGTEPLTRPIHLEECHDTRHAKRLIWTVIFGIMCFVIWTSQAPVYEIVSGNGLIRPEGLSRRIEHLEGGIVTRISVEDGDLVAPGDPLLQLDTTSLEAERRKLTAEIEILEQTLSGYGRLIDLDLRHVDPAATLARFEGASALVREELSFRLAQTQRLESTRHMEHARMQASRARRATALQELALLRGQNERYSSEAGRQVIALSQIEAVDREIIRVEGTLRSLEGEIQLSEATLDRTDAALMELLAEFRRYAAAQLEEAEEKHSLAIGALARIADRIARADLRAPVAGRVVRLSVQGAGEVVVAGEQLLEIIPLDSPVFAEVDIPADQIGSVAVGQTASVKVLTHDFTRFGDVTATVDRISATSIARDGVPPVFRVKLVLDPANPGHRDLRNAPDRRIIPGMTVRADIRSDQRSVLSYLLKPVMLISDRALTES